jgi:hypothetical protein
MLFILDTADTEHLTTKIIYHTQGVQTFKNKTVTPLFCDNKNPTQNT